MSSPTPERLRLFFALWPTPDLQAAFHRAARQVVAGGGKPVVADNLHLTLAFLGGVGAEQRACVEAMADQIRAPGFRLTLDQVGYWSRPRAVWLGCSDTPEALRDLAGQLNAGLPACGLQPEERPFAAHLTVVRKASRGPAERTLQPLLWPVDDFVLAQSVTRAEGARYSVLRRWSLTPRD